MSIQIVSSHHKLPTFIDDDREIQPIALFEQSTYIRIVQWDGAGEDHHWVLIPENEVEDFITKLREVVKK